MSQLPVIVGFGGINSAGRSSFFQSYRRLVFEALTQAEQDEVLRDLAVLGRRLVRHADGWQTSDGETVEPGAWVADHRAEILAGTLVRELDPETYDPRRVIAEHIGATAAGQLPAGFDPARLYAARQHPKGLQMTVFGMTDALGQLGIDWETVRGRVAPDRMAVYSGSAIGQLDRHGFGGLMQSRLQGGRSTSKNLALGLVEMSADFINAYVLGSLGRTGHSVGACATFLYNLQLGVEAIKSGQARVAIVGGSEAPLTPEIFDGFNAMSALAGDKSILEMQSRQGEETTQGPDHPRACRPFGDNCGMVIGEAAQFAILFDDALALELGAQLFGAVPEVHVHADGFKRSISSPGVGNYVTMAKTVAACESLLGATALRTRTFVHAHGTGTPQNRTTESHILNELARVFDIERWPVTAIKSRIGHSMAPASGDQLITALGTLSRGIVPGILTTPELAEDVHADRLEIVLDHREAAATDFDAAFLNAKGFGGNNASALVLGPHATLANLREKHGDSVIGAHADRVQATIARAEEYNARALDGEYGLIYRFNENVLAGEDIELTREELRIKGRKIPIRLAD